MNLIYDILGGALALALLAVALWSLRVFRPWLDRPEVRAWVGSYWSAALGVALYLVHTGTEPGDMLLTALRNSFLMLGIGLQWVGCLRFKDGRGALGLCLAPVVLYLGTFFLLAPNLYGRPLAFSVGGVPFLLHGAWVLVRDMPAPIRRTGRFVALTLAIHGAFHLFRAGVLILHWGTADLMLWIAVGFLEAFPVLVTLAVAQWMLVEHRMEDTAA